MAKFLVIVESPAKAKTINKFLGSDYVVKPTGGHVVDLPESELGIDIEHGFAPNYKVIKGKNRILSDLKKSAKSVENVLLATDPDREGEAIAWHVRNAVVSKDQPYYRVLINQITRDAVRQAVENKGELDINKVDAQQARRVLDRVVGYQVSPLLWRAMYKGLSAGRVQSVALRLVVERDIEIEAFVPVEYWEIETLLKPDKGGEFSAKLMKKGGEKFTIGSGDDAAAVVEELKRQSFAVADVTTKQTKRYPAAPFITSTLQQDASRRLGFNVTRTMKVAQTLYEGVELGEGATGLITYMRTDSTRIAPEALQDARAYITATWGSEHLPEKPVQYRTKKSAQDAHEAIRPAELSLPPDKVKNYLTPEQNKLYTLIWNRFIASQMKPSESTVVTVDIAAGDYLLRASCTKLDYEGFLKVYGDLKEDQEDACPALPKLSSGDPLELRDITPSQHFTKPPAFYSEATLVRELESLGIGRPSTYAQIINTIVARKYVTREKGKLMSSDLGRQVNRILVDSFPDLFNVDFTAGMESVLDKIESGECEWSDVVSDFYGPFSESLEKMKATSKEIKKSMIEETDEVCEKCGSPMIIRWGRNGKFMACSGFPECKNTRPLKEDAPEITDVKCDKCGSPMEVKTGRFGRFLACSNYPDCKNIKPFTLGVKCPLEGCTGEMVEKKSKKGRIFYGCNQYPKCKFASWTKPVAHVCPECGSPSMVETRNPGELSCPRCKTMIEPQETQKV